MEVESRTLTDSLTSSSGSLTMVENDSLTDPSIGRHPSSTGQNAKDNPPIESPSPPTASIFFNTSRHDLLLLIPAAISTVASAATAPVETVLMGKIFDALSHFSSGTYSISEFENHVLSNVTGIFILGVISVIVTFIMLLLWSLFGDKQAHCTRYNMFTDFLSRDLSWLDDEKGIMGKVTMSNRNIEELRVATSFSAAIMARAVAIIVISLAIAFRYSWALTLVSLAGLPFVALTGVVTAAPIGKNLSKGKEYNTKASATLHWSVSSIKTVKNFNTQKLEFESFKNTISTASKYFRTFFNLYALQQGIGRILILAMFVQGFYYGFHLVADGKLTTGHVITVFWSCINAADSFHSLAPQMIFIRRGQVAAAGLKNFRSDTKNSIESYKRSIGLYPQHCNGYISFQNVSMTRIGFQRAE